jgi:hypothetical protein
MHMKLSHLTVALAALTWGSVASATDLYGTQTSAETWQVSVGTFTGVSLPDPTNAIKAVVPSMNWGGSHRTPIAVGSSGSGNACRTFAFFGLYAAGNFTIIMSPSAHSSGVREEIFTCSTSPYQTLIFLYPAPGQTPAQSWGINMQDDSKRDIGMAVLKVLTQRHAGGAASSTSCVSNASTNGALLSARGQWCYDDMENLGYWAGHWRSSVSGLYNSSGTFPSVSGWSALTTGTLVSGFAGMSGWRTTQSGTDRYKMLTTIVDGLPHDLFIYDNYTTGSSGVLLDQPSLSWLRRSTMAYDDSRGVWALAGTTSGGLLQVWTTTDWVNWNGAGPYVDPCAPNTMCPVNLGGHHPAIAYDPATDRYVLIFTWSQATNGNCGSGRNAPGCSGELMLVSITANQHGQRGGQQLPRPLHDRLKVAPGARGVFRYAGSSRSFIGSCPGPSAAARSCPTPPAPR